MESGNRRITFGHTKPGTAAPRSGAQKDTKTLAEIVRHDFFEERPMWPFTCYAPHGLWMTDVGMDKSFEELRYMELRALKVERQNMAHVLAQTHGMLEEARTSMQMYYHAKCGMVSGNAGSQIFLRRNRGGGNAGFGTSDPYQGSYGPGSPVVELPNSSVHKSSNDLPPAFTFDHMDFPQLTTAPNGSATLPRRLTPLQDIVPSEECTNPPVEAEIEEDQENPWLAAEFTYIPETAPPDKYI